MTTNILLSGTVQLSNGVTWHGHSNLENLTLVKQGTDVSTCSEFSVTFTIETIVPLQAVKLYSLNRHEQYHAMTTSSVLCDYLSTIFKSTTIVQQPKYALVLCIERLEELTANPFDDNEAHYPLDKRTYVLLYGRQLHQDSIENNSVAIQVYGQVIRDKFNYTNLYTVSIRAVETDKEDDYTEPAKSMLRTYRPDLASYWEKTPQRPQRQSWEAILNTDMDRLSKLDQLREESRLNRPERTLTVTKRKLFSQRKNANVMPPPSSIPSARVIKRATSASSTLPFWQSTKNIPISSTYAQFASSIPSPSSSLSPSIDSTHHAANKKQLKSAIWSKLLSHGHDKKLEDTKLLYHSIYQSIQFVTRKTFKEIPLNPSLMNSLIDRHIQFYSMLDLEVETFIQQ